MTTRIYKERHVYFYKCSQCHKRRVSNKKRIAVKVRICRKCRGRRAPQIDESQQSLFNNLRAN